jgi:hypothetical protein
VRTQTLQERTTVMKHKNYNSPKSNPRHSQFHPHKYISDKDPGQNKQSNQSKREKFRKIGSNDKIRELAVNS